MRIEEGDYFVWRNTVYYALESQHIDEDDYDGDVRIILEFDIFSTYSERESVCESLKVVNLDYLEDGDYEIFDAEIDDIDDED